MSVSACLCLQHAQPVKDGKTGQRRTRLSFQTWSQTQSVVRHRG